MPRASSTRASRVQLPERMPACLHPLGLAAVPADSRAPGFSPRLTVLRRRRVRFGAACGRISAPSSPFQLRILVCGSPPPREASTDRARLASPRLRLHCSPTVRSVSLRAERMESAVSEGSNPAPLVARAQNLRESTKFFPEPWLCNAAIDPKAHLLKPVTTAKATQREPGPSIVARRARW